MSIARFFVAELELIRPGAGLDSRDDPVPDWDTATTTPVRGWLTQTATSENNDGRSSVRTDAVVFLPVGTDVVAGDRVRDADDRLWEVNGRPAIAKTPSGPHHVEAALVAVEG